MRWIITFAVLFIALPDWIEVLNCLPEKIKIKLRLYDYCIIMHNNNNNNNNNITTTTTTTTTNDNTNNN